MAKKKNSDWDNLEPQKSSAAQFITYVASIALNHAESELEKYRIVQDKLFLSDYDCNLLALEEAAKKGKEVSAMEYWLWDKKKRCNLEVAPLKQRFLTRCNRMAVSDAVCVI